MKQKLLYPLLFILILSLPILFQKSTQAQWSVDGNGSLVYEGQVLGESDDNDKSDKSGSGSSGSGSSGSGSSGSSGSDSSGSSDSGGSSSTTTTQPSTSSIEVDEEDGVETFPRVRTDEGKTEIRFSETERIKTRVKDGETRTDIYSGGVKVRLERKDGRLIIKAETEAGEETELGEQELFKVEERIDKNIVKVATGEADSMVFARGAFAAQTNFPLSVDLATNELIVTTPAGEKRVAVLPDQAVQNLLAANVIDRIGAGSLASLAQELEGVSSVFLLGQRNNIPVYEIKGISEQKFLGFIPVTIPREAVVSTETGEVVEQDTLGLFATVVDFLSF